MVRIKKSSSLIAFALIISMFAQIVSPAFADAPKYEKPLPVVSGSQSDLRTFTYDGHVVSVGFAVSTSMMAAVEPNEFSFSRAACAVSLSSTGWSESIYSFEPWVTSIWVKVEGNSFYRVNVGGIADNTGTGGSCTSSWEIVLDILLTIIPYLLEYLAQEPPLKEWQNDLHWAKAIARSKDPYEGGRIQPKHNPCVETEGCDFSSLFSQTGYQYLTVTAGADIAVVRSWWARGDYLYWDVIPVNSYSVTFQVGVPVTNEPETPSIPSGPSSGGRGSSYTYSTTAVDPDGDNVRYQFDWGDSTTTTTGWYASGVAASASHSWSNFGTYQVQVRAQDVYEEWSCWSPILTVSIANRPPNIPSTPSGPTSGYTSSTYSYSTSTTDPDGDSVQYVFDWDDGTTTNTAWYASGATASASHSWTSTGTKYVEVHARDTLNEWSGWSSTLAVSISTPPPPPPGGGGGSCPFVSIWDGSKYVLDNNILPTSQLGKGSDVEDYYALERTLIQDHAKYSFVVSEFQNEHSYLDQVRLLAVDHESDVNIAVTPDGEILTYKDPLSPISCVDSSGIDNLSQIRYVDGDLTNPATFFQGYTNDYLLLNFGQVRSENAKLIVRNDMFCMDKCILVQVVDTNGEWLTVAVIASRAIWATEGVNLSPYLVQGKDLMVRLMWTQPHKLDYVGLDTTKQDDYEVHYAKLVSAVHSNEGEVKSQLLEGDNVYAELVPGEQIELAFTLPQAAREARTYIFYVEGHYYTIAN